MKSTQPLLYVAWKKLIGAYVLALAIGFLAGVIEVPDDFDSMALVRPWA